MKNEQQVKQAVRQKYGEIVSEENKPKATGCCGDSNELEALCCFSEGYDTLDGYVPESDYGLGCGLPTEQIDIKEGDTVLDLGAGAGNDCFIARRYVGENGYVIGVDMTPEMIFKARENASKLNYSNVDFRLGEIEALPVASDSIDIIISNCVVNLVPDKAKAFKETFRVLKPGGSISISDIVVNGTMPESLRNDLSAYAGCISGAENTEDYLNQIKLAGFENVSIKQSKRYNLPASLIDKYPELSSTDKSAVFLESITVSAEKPIIEEVRTSEPCCTPEATEEKCC